MPHNKYARQSLFSLLFPLLLMAILLSGCVAPRVLSLDEYRQSVIVQAECDHIKPEGAKAHALCIEREAKKQLESDKQERSQFWKPVRLTALIAGAVLFSLLLNILLVF